MKAPGTPEVFHIFSLNFAPDARGRLNVHVRESEAVVLPPCSGRGDPPRRRSDAGEGMCLSPGL